MRFRSAIVLTAVFAACQGDGSDIGPRLQRLPDASTKVLVLDDQGRGVCAARVSVGGATAITGRNGRGDLFADPRGRQQITLDVSAASATASDRIVSPFAFACRADLTGSDLPFAIHVPDASASATLSVFEGTQSSTAVLDDTAQSGAKLTIPSGTAVVIPAAAIFIAQATFRIARLEPAHLPGDVPVAGTGAWLFGRGYAIDPSTSFTPGITLEVPDDLGVGAGTASLFHLSQDGDWQLVASGATSSGGRLSVANGVTESGLWTYGVQVATTATVRGRVVDAKGVAVGGAYVRVDAQHAITGSDGRFAFAAVPATLLDGTPRAAVVELRGGGSWLPVGSATATPTLAAATFDLGDLALDTLPCGNVRVQQSKRGKLEPFRRLGLGTLDCQTGAVAFADRLGQATFEEVPSGWFGFAVGHPVDREKLFFAQGETILPAGRRWFDVNVFYDDRFWFIGSRSTRTIALDRRGGGPITGAAIVRGSTDLVGASGLTQQAGTVFVGRAFDGRATASVRTELGGNSFINAFTIERPNGDHLEMPLRRGLRQPIGAFDRHGVVTGSMIGVNLAAEQRLRSTRLLELQDWFDDTMLGNTMGGEPVQSAVPIKVDPTLVPGDFRVGVAVPAGNLAVAQGTTTSNVFTLDAVGLTPELEVTEAAINSRNLSIDLPATTPFTATQALTGLDAGLTTADLAFDLALERATGRIVDVARGIGGNLAASGSDAVLTLPALSGDLAGLHWLCALGARATTATTAVEQRLMLRLDAGTTASNGFLAVPTLAAPIDGATVPATGFTVDFALPAGSLYGTIELHNGGGSDLRWEVVVPPETTTFRFQRLPADVETPMRPGLAYTLTITAYRADDGVVRSSPDPYRDLTTYWITIGAAERGVRAVSSRTITITTN